MSIDNSYNYVSQTFFKLLKKEIKGETIGEDLKELYTFVKKNKLDFKKVYEICSIPMNKDNMNTVFTKKHLYKIESMKNQFDVYFIGNNPIKSRTPLFPKIQINIDFENVFFFQIVRTQCKHLDKDFPRILPERFENQDPETGTFIDSLGDTFYPFYSAAPFFDEPDWGHVNFIKWYGTKTWVAHCYAIQNVSEQISKKDKTSIKKLKIERWKIQPTPIYPSPLSMKHFNKDRVIFYPLLKKYKGEFIID